MKAVFNGSYFTTEFGIYLETGTSYAVSTQASIKEVVKLLEPHEITEINFIGRNSIFKDIEKYYKNNKPEVIIRWL